jgi:hypothetical protein
MVVIVAVVSSMTVGVTVMVVAMALFVIAAVVVLMTVVNVAFIGRWIADATAILIVPMCSRVVAGRWVVCAAHGRSGARLR